LYSELSLVGESYGRGLPEDTMAKASKGCFISFRGFFIILQDYFPKFLKHKKERGEEK
jgi:hypothetical protein